MANTPNPKKKPAVTRTRKTAVRKTPTPAASNVDPPVIPPVETGPRYVRNLSGAPFRMKLNRHTPGQQGIQLKPRGERGDMAPLEEVDYQDPILSDNTSLGLVEIITQHEATNAMGKQTINQRAVHPALAALRNENDEEGLTLNVQRQADEDSIVVAELDNGEIAFERQTPGKGAEIKRPARAPGESPGTPANIPGAEPGHSPANESATFLSDLRDKTKVNPVQGS